jgi:hypothetical protein
MSPFDMAVFAVPISFIIAILPGPPGMASAAATDLPMFSPVHAIIAADAGLIANTMAIVAVANRAFILFSPSAAECRFDNDNQWARFRYCQGHHWSNPVNEPQGTHWRDVWGDQVAAFPGEVEQPTDANISKAARAAIATIQESRKPGRTHNRADQILADRLGQIFRGSGQPIRRSNEPVMRDGKSVYVEGGGPFYRFLELVLKPLQRYLRERGLAPVTVATIVRLVTDDFPAA